MLIILMLINFNMMSIIPSKNMIKKRINDNGTFEMPNDDKYDSYDLFSYSLNKEYFQRLINVQY